MKKYLLLFSTLLIFVACSSYDKDLGLPQDYIEFQQKNISEQKKILAENPEDVDAQHSLGFYYQQIGENDEAIEAYEKVLASNENHFAALNNLADIYEEAEEYDKAAIYIKRLYEKYPDSIEVIKDTVRILLKADEPDNALTALENFTKIKGNADAGINQVVSDLFESIRSYQPKNEK